MVFVHSRKAVMGKKNLNPYNTIFDMLGPWCFKTMVLNLLFELLSQWIVSSGSCTRWIFSFGWGDLTHSLKKIYNRREGFIKGVQKRFEPNFPSREWRVLSKWQGWWLLFHAFLPAPWRCGMLLTSSLILGYVLRVSPWPGSLASITRHAVCPRHRARMHIPIAFPRLLLSWSWHRASPRLCHGEPGHPSEPFTASEIHAFTLLSFIFSVVSSYEQIDCVSKS